MGKRTIPSKARRTAMIPLFYVSVDSGWSEGPGPTEERGGKALTEHRIRHWVSHASLAHAVRARRLFRRQGGLTFDRRQEPDALARTSGSARGDRGNPVPYRDNLSPRLVEVAPIQGRPGLD